MIARTHRQPGVRLAVLLLGLTTSCTLLHPLDELSPSSSSGAGGTTAVGPGSGGAGVGPSAGGGGAAGLGGQGGGGPTLHPYPAAVLEDMPLAYWRLGDAINTFAKDEIDNGNPGQFVGDCELGATGAIDGDTAVEIHPTDCRVELGDAFAFPGRGSFTLELWVYPYVVDVQVRRLLEHNTPSGASEGYTLYYGEDFLVFSRSANGSEVGFAATGPLTPNRYTYVVATYDSNETNLYVDAVRVGGQASTQEIGDVVGELVVGDGARGQFYKVNGVIDEIAIYAQALSQNRIEAHYAASGR